MDLVYIKLYFHIQIDFQTAFSGQSGWDGIASPETDMTDW